MSRWIRPALGGVLQRLGDRQRDPQRLFLVEGLVLVEKILDGRAFHVLHHEVVVAVDHAGVDRVDDVVMRQLGGDHRFALESLDELFVLGEGIEQDLDRDDPVDARLLGLVDHPHRALAELLDHLVAGDLKLAIGLAGLLHQPRHLAAGQDLGLDHDLQQALGNVVFLGDQLLTLRLACLDLGGRGQAAPENRLLQLRFVDGRRALGVLARDRCFGPDWPSSRLPDSEQTRRD